MVPPQAARAFLAKGGRLTVEASPEAVSTLQAQAAAMGKSLGAGDAQVVACGMACGAPIMTGDKQPTQIPTGDSI